MCERIDEREVQCMNIFICVSAVSYDLYRYNNNDGYDERRIIGIYIPCQSLRLRLNCASIIADIQASAAGHLIKFPFDIVA